MADDIALLVADIYEAAGELRRSGESIAKTQGQSQARWQVLSVISEQPLTVPSAARRLGVSRQSVQRIANNLVDDGLVRASSNPDHRASPLFELTPAGARALDGITARATVVNHALATSISPADIAVTRKVLRNLTLSIQRR